MSHGFNSPTIPQAWDVWQPSYCVLLIPPDSLDSVVPAPVSQFHVVHSVLWWDTGWTCLGLGDVQRQFTDQVRPKLIRGGICCRHSPVP